MKRNIMEDVCIVLLKDGHTIKSLTRTCFDIVARKEAQILLIKILEDADSISTEYANEMKKLAYYIGGCPLIIAERAASVLQDNVVYKRYGVISINFSTFKNCIGNRMPFIVSDHSGLSVSIVPEKLNEVIEDEGISLNSVSKKIGVSKRMIQKYKEGNTKVTINNALRMYKTLGGGIFRKIDIFRVKEEHFKPVNKSDITKKYNELGFEATRTTKVPFDVVAKKEKEIIFTELGDKTNPYFQSFSKLVDAKNLVIFSRKKPKNIPAITKKEFMDFEKAKELIKFLEEYS